ncbi:5-methylcytosine-specific restriction endonuclease McrBC regulatory subunit McrC [Staphylococcus hominis]
MNHETAQSDWQTVASCLASQNYISIVKGLVHHFTAIDDNHRHMLPTMRSDVILTYGKQCLIIDTKYYTSMLQQYFDTRTIHSGNLYQIFAYVKKGSTSFKTKTDKCCGDVTVCENG